MTGVLDGLVERARGEALVVEPRLRSRFEPAGTGIGAMEALPLEESEDAPPLAPAPLAQPAPAPAPPAVSPPATGPAASLPSVAPRRTEPPQAAEQAKPAGRPAPPPAAAEPGVLRPAPQEAVRALLPETRTIEKHSVVERVLERLPSEQRTIVQPGRHVVEPRTTLAPPTPRTAREQAPAHRAPAATQVRHTAQAAAEHVVQVTIGRVEIRAATPSEKPRPAVKPGLMALQEYRQRRTSGELR